MAVNSSDPFGGLTGTSRDAAVALKNLFHQYGLDTLSGRIVDFIRQGYGQDTISVLLQDTPEYKQRFQANDQRLKKGLPALTPQEYIQTENAFRQYMSQAGLPVGFYDQPSDFTKWIADDVAPTEIKQRLDDMTNYVNQADSATLDYFKQHYSNGEILAYALDRSRAEPLLQKNLAAAQVGGAAAAQGIAIDAGLAGQLAGQGVNQGQARQGFGFIATEKGVVGKLGQIYGGDAVNQNDLVAEVFQDNASATEKRRKLIDQEHATFSGSAGVGKTSLGTPGGGKF